MDHPPNRRIFPGVPADTRPRLSIANDSRFRRVRQKASANKLKPRTTTTIPNDNDAQNTSYQQSEATFPYSSSNTKKPFSPRQSNTSCHKYQRNKLYQHSHPKMPYQEPTSEYTRTGAESVSHSRVVYEGEVPFMKCIPQPIVGRMVRLIAGGQIQTVEYEEPHPMSSGMKDHRLMPYIKYTETNILEVAHFNKFESEQTIKSNEMKYSSTDNIPVEEKCIEAGAVKVTPNEIKLLKVSDNNDTVYKYSIVEEGNNKVTFNGNRANTEKLDNNTKYPTNNNDTDNNISMEGSGYHDAVKEEPSNKCYGNEKVGAKVTANKDSGNNDNIKKGIFNKDTAMKQSLINGQGNEMIDTSVQGALVAKAKDGKGTKKSVSLCSLHSLLFTRYRRNTLYHGIGHLVNPYPFYGLYDVRHAYNVHPMPQNLVQPPRPIWHYLLLTLLVVVVAIGLYTIGERTVAFVMPQRTIIEILLEFVFGTRRW